MARIDEPVEIREGEELNNRKVEAFLRDTIPGLEGEFIIRQFPSGFSNLTYLIQIGNKEMILRRPPFGKKAKTAHDMSREYKILNALHPVFPYAPKPLAYSENTEVMECPFYVMERISGVILPPWISASESSLLKSGSGDGGTSLPFCPQPDTIRIRTT